jgi:hypothetical protein
VQVYVMSLPGRYRVIAPSPMLYASFLVSVFGNSEL